MQNNLVEPLETIRKKFLESTGHDGDIPDKKQCLSCGFKFYDDDARIKSFGIKCCTRCASENIDVFIGDIKPGYLYRLEKDPLFVKYITGEDY